MRQIDKSFLIFAGFVSIGIFLIIFLAWLNAKVYYRQRRKELGLDKEVGE